MRLRLCTKANVEVAVGGAHILVELLDKDRDGVADPDQVDAVIVQASADVLSAVQVAVALSSLREPYPDVVVFHTARIAAYYAWLNSSSGQAVPPNIRESYEAALRWLDRLTESKRGLGVEPAHVASHGLGLVEVNPRGDRVTRESMEGFW